MPARPRRSPLPNLKVYRVAWVVAAVLVIVALFTLGNADTPKLSQEPPSFDGEAAYADLVTIVEDFPQRVAGTDPDNRMGIWVEQQFRAHGPRDPHRRLHRHRERQGRGAAERLGHRQGTHPGDDHGPRQPRRPAAGHAGRRRQRLGRRRHARLAARVHRHGPRAHHSSSCAPPATRSAPSARATSPRSTRRTTSTRCIALRDVAKRDSDGIGLDGWSAEPKTAPPWLWLLSAPAAKRDSNLDADAADRGGAGAAPRRARPARAARGRSSPEGVPAITVSAAGPSAPAAQRHARHGVQGDADQGRARPRRT